MRAPLLLRRRLLRRRVRRGVTLLNAIVLAALGLFVGFFWISWTQHARVPSRQNECRSNLSNLATAMLLYDGRHGHLPGYMNAMERSDGSLYFDPDTGRPTAVSWCVELLSDLDRGALYEEWRKVRARDTAAAPTAAATVPQTAATTTSAAPSSDYRSVYLEILTCPSAPGDRRLPLLHYVVNSGMRDLAHGLPAVGDKPGVPRDHEANGLLFDNYSESPLVKPDAATRAPQVVTSFSRIRDPKDRTILITENADAGLYSLPGSEAAVNDATNNEIAWGCIWSPGPITRVGGKPMMSPGDDALAPNADTGSSHGRSDYRYARPSSHHPGGFHVAFAGKNVQFINEKISYIVYAKLMASDDANAKLPGSETLLDASFHSLKVMDEDLNP